MGAIETSDLQDMRELLTSLAPKPGEECQVCHRPYPKKRADDQPGPRREVLSIATPKGYPPLEPLLIDLVDKYREEWPLDYAAMRDDIGLEVVGGRSWKYHALHFATYACLMVPGLAPTEEGQTGREDAVTERRTG